MSLNKPFSKTYTIPILFENVPSNQKISNAPMFLKTTLTEKGWYFIFNPMKNKTIIIDLKEYDIQREINFTNTKALVQEKMLNYHISEVNPSFFTLNFDKLTEKKVPIKVNFEKQLSKQNDFGTAPIAIPDSVIISSDANTLKNIQFVTTDLVTVKDNDSLIQNISLSQQENCKINLEKIDVRFDILEYVEKEIEVKIKIDNIKKNQKVIIYPDAINIKFLVPIKFYENILPSDFYISADFNNIEVKSTKNLKLSIKKQPKLLKNIVLEKDNIEFLIYQ